MMKRAVVTMAALMLVACGGGTGTDGGAGGGTGGGTAGGSGGGTGGGTAGGAGGGTGGGTDGGTDGGTADAGFPIDVQILAISDWHGQLDPLTAPGPLADGGTGNVSTAGASALSAYFQRDRAANPNTLTVTAGDEFGASPPLASFFNEEPAVQALNLMGVQANTLGNHNFDKGLSHLQQMVGLADYTYVSTNLNNLTGALTGIDTPYRIVDVGGVQVGIVGITNTDAASLVGVGRMGAITVDDLPTTATKAMAAQAAAKAAGANIVIALVHMGATFKQADGGVTGPLVDFANLVTGFTAIIGDHTDIQFAATVNNQLVVENRSKGVSYSRVAMTVHTGTNAVTNLANAFVTPYRPNFFADGGVAADPMVDALVDTYRTQLASVMDQPIGKTNQLFVRTGSLERTQEVPIGNLVADSARLRYGTDVALTNAGGIRASLPSSYVVVDAGMPVVRTGCSVTTPCDLVRGDVFTVLPFGNVVVTRTVTGAQLWSAMEHGLAVAPASNGRFPQISGFTVTYSQAADAGMRVASMALVDGGAIPNDATTFTFATNDFTNAGGDGYLMLADGQGTSREVMADVLVDYIRSFAAPLDAPDGGRIIVQ